MDKPAITVHEIHPLLARRWSPVAFADRDVSSEQLASVLEAARWAPSCFNEQPWHYLVARKGDVEEFERMVHCLVEGNRVWASKAPVLMISVAAMRFSRNDTPNRHAYHDVGLASENLVIQATALGLVAHQMGGFDVEKARLVYRIPAGHDPVAALALGWPGDPDELPADLRKRELSPRARKPLRDFVFTGNWGRTLEF